MDSSEEGEKEIHPSLDLHEDIRHRFQHNQPGKVFTNPPKEFMAIKGLIDKARARSPDNPRVCIFAMIDTFQDLRDQEKKLPEKERFFLRHPFLPSALNVSGIWDRVADKLDQQAEKKQKDREKTKRITPGRFPEVCPECGGAIRTDTQGKSGFRFLCQECGAVYNWERGEWVKEQVETPAAIDIF